MEQSQDISELVLQDRHLPSTVYPKSLGLFSTNLTGSTLHKLDNIQTGNLLVGVDEAKVTLRIMPIIQDSLEIHRAWLVSIHVCQVNV